jgi:hypothetical protein
MAMLNAKPVSRSFCVMVRGSCKMWWVKIIDKEVKTLRHSLVYNKKEFKFERL